ncbi:hypothetical protein FNF27_04092 [Cafeteria roenbergensis]|uniref:Folate receptor-like domain-containing protein n=1 Tax=Cafeteria roenbergensis TaxID=33653 RepID=A0A5A8D5J0_CAFRO|nr:hypothetical protein FNF31_04678 [Cafeteria roenbergensis]KAA0174496.1 hypothetical protein FNF27_04092 [Cafeteria roenbergensis]
MRGVTACLAALVLLAALPARAQVAPQGVSATCNAATTKLVTSIMPAIEKFQDANPGCLTKCNPEVASACESDCVAGLSDFSAACKSAGGHLYIVAHRIFFDAPNTPEQRVNQYQCLSPSCEGSNDMLVYDAFFQAVLCNNRFGGAPVKECFADLRPFAALTPGCQAGVDTAATSADLVKALATYQDANKQCFAACDPRGTKACDATCYEASGELASACSAAGGEVQALQADVALAKAVGNATIRYLECAPKPCTEQAALPAYEEDRAADYCDEFSAMDVASCSVQLLPGGLGPSAGSIIGGLAAATAAIALTGFLAYHGSIRAGWVRRESIPAPTRRVCECACILERCGSSRGSTLGAYSSTTSGGGVGGTPSYGGSSRGAPDHLGASRTSGYSSIP